MSEEVAYVWAPCLPEHPPPSAGSLSQHHPPPPNKMSEFEEAKVVADPEVEVGGRRSPEKKKN